jgi:hypothetical protein
MVSSSFLTRFVHRMETGQITACCLLFVGSSDPMAQELARSGDLAGTEITLLLISSHRGRREPAFSLRETEHHVVRSLRLLTYY